MGEQHYKRVSEKNSCLVIIFWEDFLSWKWLKIALKTHEIAPFFKNVLEGACPQPPPSNGSQLRCLPAHALRHIYSNSKIFRIGPPPEKSCIRPWIYVLNTTQHQKKKKKKHIKIIISIRYIIVSLDVPYNLHFAKLNSDYKKRFKRANVMGGGVVQHDV